MDDERVYVLGVDTDQLPRHEWAIVDYNGAEHAPCRFAIVPPEGGVVYWTHWEAEARRLVRGMRVNDHVQLALAVEQFSGSFAKTVRVLQGKE